MNKKPKSIIVIAGPTAVGKTSLSILLAKRYKTVIISADSRQFYKELILGTAKPSEAELIQAEHFFINSLSIHDNYDVARFEQEVLKLLEKLFLSHDVVIVTGGSGLFIKALCEGMSKMPEIPLYIRDKWNSIHEEKGLEYLQQELHKIDSSYFSVVDKNNPMRIIRALEVFDASGQNMSYWRSQKEPVPRNFNIIKIGLTREREELYSRIDGRMDLMIEAGLFEEAKELYAYKDLNALRTVGYTEIFGFLDGHYDYSEAVRLLKRNSRRYAKRQLTWFKKDEAFHCFHPDNENEITEFIDGQLAN